MSSTVPGELSRRQLFRSAGALTTVAALATAAGALGTTSAAAATPTYQDNWRYCSACACLKYSNGTTFDGNCCQWNAGYGVRGGAHNSGSRNYYLYTSAAGVAGQSGWKYCGDCGEIYWPSVGSRCPINVGPHNSGPKAGSSYTYVLLNTTSTNPMAGQSGWRYCSACHALVWPPAVKSSPNQCPSLRATGHVVSGYDYIMPYF